VPLICSLLQPPQPQPVLFRSPRATDMTMIPFVPCFSLRRAASETCSVPVHVTPPKQKLIPRDNTIWGIFTFPFCETKVSTTDETTGESECTAAPSSARG
jgi:hypothetical protein